LHCQTKFSDRKINRKIFSSIDKGEETPIFLTIKYTMFFGNFVQKLEKVAN
jgi:hypothetical protein